MRQPAWLHQGQVPYCLTSLVAFYGALTASVDKGKATDDIYLDFNKAFDMVPHGQCQRPYWRNMDLMGGLFSGSVNGGHIQTVAVIGSMSRWRFVESGVPQGSIMKPVLFINFINDIVGLITPSESCQMRPR